MGGGGCQKTALSLFVFCCCFLFVCFFVLFYSSQLILQFYSGLSMVYFKENYNFPRFLRRSNIFQGEGGGSNIFQVGSNFFQGGGGGGGSKCLFV